MNLGLSIDRLIAAFAPVWARKRLAARTNLNLLQRAYEASKPDRLSGRARHPRRSAVEESRQNLADFRAQARELYRRNPYASGTVNSIVANLIGCGIRPKPTVMQPRLLSPDERFNDAAEEAWKRWADSADLTGRQSFYSIQGLILREKLVAGECLVAIQTPADKREVPLALEVLSSERLADKDEERKDGSKILQGVEFSPDGRIVAYWIYPNDPWSFLRGSKPERRPADEIIHIFDQLEPGQVRGVTRFVSTAGTFEALAQYLDFELTKARVASAFALMITQEGGTITFPSSGEPTPEKDAEGNPLEYLEGGMIMHGKPGEDIRGVGPTITTTAFDPFVALMLRGIARGLDVSYELVTRDLSKVTYLSARQGENQDRRHWEPQQEALSRQLNAPVWRHFLELALIAGTVPGRVGQLERYLTVEFVRPGWDWIDPLKEVEADEKAIQAGLRSPIEVIRRRGGDPWKILSELEQFKSWAKEKGLELSIFQPKATAAAGFAPPALETEMSQSDGAMNSWPRNGKKSLPSSRR